MALTEFAERHDLPFNVRILETRLQRVFGQEVHGKSLIRYMHELGALDERKVVIHSIWVHQADIDFMAASGCSITHNPISNLKIGSGVMPFRVLKGTCIPICLGSDEASVDDTANMWGVAKMAGLIHKITDPDVLAAFDERLQCKVRDLERRRHVAIDLGDATRASSSWMDKSVRKSLHRAARKAGVNAVEIASGGGHDCAVFCWRGVPSAMIFVASDHGSHNPDEHIEMADFDAACRVLAAYVDGVIRDV